jgi:hypothetical protein
MFINGCFTLHFDMTRNHNFSEGHGYLSKNVNIRIELKFDTAISNAILLPIPRICTWFSDRHIALRHNRHLKLVMDTMKIYCALRNIFAFLGFYPSEIRPHSVMSFCNINIIPQVFINRFAANITNADIQIKHLIYSEFGKLFIVGDEILLCILYEPICRMNISTLSTACTLSCSERGTRWDNNRRAVYS